MLGWLLLLPLVILFWLLLTPSGLHSVCRIAGQFSGQALTIQQSEGELVHDFVLEDVRWRGRDGSRADIARIELRWQPLALLQARFHAERLRIEGLQLRLPASNMPPPPSAPLKLPVSLPLDIALDDGRLSRFSLLEGERTLFQLDDGSVAGSWLGDRVQVIRLDSALPQTGLLHLQGIVRMAPDRLHIESLQLKGPGLLSASGVIGIESTPTDLSLQGQQLRWPLVTRADRPAVAQIDGHLRLQGRPDAWQATIETRGQAYQLPFTLKGSASGDAGSAKIGDLELHTQGRDSKSPDGVLGLNGPIAWEPALKADLDANLTNIDPGLFARDWSGRLNGRLSTRSVIQEGEPMIDFDLQLTPSLLRGYPLQLASRGQVNARRVRLDTLDLKAAQGRLKAQGQVGWEPKLGGDLSLTLSQLNPGVFDRDWTGRINGTMTLATSSTAAGEKVTAIRAQLDHSQLRGRPVSLDASGQLRQPDPAHCGKAAPACSMQLAIDTLVLRSGTSRLDAAGDALPPFDLHGRLDSPDLTQLDPQVSGRASLEFTLQGPLASPHLVTQGQISQLKQGELRLGQLRWDADVDPQVDSHIDLLASDGEAGVHIGQLRLAVKGKEIYHQARLDAVTDQGTASASLQGGYDRKRQEWGGELEALTLAPNRLTPWSLEKGVGILLGGRRLSIEPACLSADGAHFCLNLMRAVLDPGLDLHWNLAAVPLRSFQALMPPHRAIDGRLDGQGQLHWLNGDIEDTRAQLTLSDGRLTTDRASIEFDPIHLAVEQFPDRVHATFDLRAAQGNLQADLSAANADRLMDRPLSGQVSVTIPDLAFLQTFVRELKSIGGHVGGQLGFAGTLANPRISGELALEQGHALLATPGIQINDASLHLRGAGSGPLALEGALHSGGGVMTLAGTLDPSVTPPRVDLRVAGQDFQAVSVPDARIWVSPDLHLVNDADVLGLSGTLTVPRAELTPQGFGDNPGVTASRDQVLVGTPQAEVQGGPQLTASISFVFGDQVHFSGFGLTTRLEGSVDVDEVPGYDTAGQGELRLVDGHYKAYGQDLTIERGRLIFDGGPVTQPAVDISAYRQPQSDIRVGVRARGPLDQPLLSLYSDPAMAREQQLSWLLFGRPLEQNSSADRSMLSSAALSLGLSGGDFLMEQIGKRIGLDTVSVGAAPGTSSDVATDASRISGSQESIGAGSTTTNTSQNAQLTLGKYLTSRIFVSYGVSLFQNGQTFRLLYDIGHGVKLQTETSTSGSGGDVLYTFDRGK